jgi:epoxyqueuosine reductase
VNGAKVKQEIRSRARELGFDRVGFAKATPCRDTNRLRDWLAKGRHGEMEWMGRGVDRRTNPERILPGAKTVISLLTFYDTSERAADILPRAASTLAKDLWRGRISKYAWGSDYHNVLGRRLDKLARSLAEIAPGATIRAGVDHRPILEKEWAERAGLGWIGKHTNLITEDRGSYCFVSELVTDLELPEDRARAERCGKCEACLEACPTGAIVAPFEVDARRCISYLTIELKGSIPPELRPLVGEWIFGCDICQDVCPWNRFSVPVTEPRFRLDEGRFDGDPAEFLELTDEEFLERFEGSPVRRAGRNGFLRNVCVSLGNRGDPAAVPALLGALRDDSPLVREHAAWALGRLPGERAREGLREQLAREKDPRVREEILLALEESGSSAL